MAKAKKSKAPKAKAAPKDPVEAFAADVIAGLKAMQKGQERGAKADAKDGYYETALSQSIRAEAYEDAISEVECALESRDPSAGSV